MTGSNPNGSTGDVRHQKARRILSTTGVDSRGVTGTPGESTMAPLAVGLDAFINCDTEGITVSLTDQLHLVDAGIMNQGSMDLDGLGDMMEGTQGSEQPAGPMAAGDVLAVPMAAEDGLVAPVMVGVGAAALLAGAPGGVGGAVAPESRRG